MKTVCKWAIIVAVFAALELYFGVDDTGGRVALALLIWCSLSIPLSLAFGQFCRTGGMDGFKEELQDRARYEHLRGSGDNVP